MLIDYNPDLSNIAYISNLRYYANTRTASGKAAICEDVTEACALLGVKMLILCGGISYNYHDTIEIIHALYDSLAAKDISLRFILGNTDYYYPKDEYKIVRTTPLRKENKMAAIRKIYNSDNLCSMLNIENHPIVSPTVVISGATYWYDYTLYRGKPIPISKLIRKRFFGYRNKDAKYITDNSYYRDMTATCQDIYYAQKAHDSLNTALSNLSSQYKSPSHRIHLTYFMPSKVFTDSVRCRVPILKRILGYKAAFEGASSLHYLMLSHNISRCVIGYKSRQLASLPFCRLTVDSQFSPTQYSGASLWHNLIPMPLFRFLSRSVRSNYLCTTLLRTSHFPK